VYFEGDEAHFSSIGHSLATTGANLKGETLPVLMDIGDPLGGPPSPWGNSYYQPFLFYLLAATFKILPFTEASARLPAALIGGVISAMLIYALCRRAIGSHAGALGAALVLALAPIEVLVSRRAVDYVGPVPFVLGWLWCLWRWTQQPRDARAFAVGVVLGCGVYTYISSWVLMPLYLAMSYVVFARRSASPRRAIAIATLAFVLALLPLVIWLASHPEMLQQTAARYETAGRVAAPSPGFAAVLTDLARSYWSFFDPMTWFVFGGPSLTTSTGRVGMFLLPVAALFPLGWYVLWRRRPNDLPAWVLAIGFLTAPLPAAMIREGGAVQRAMGLVVFVAIVCGFAVDWLWRSERRSWRSAVAALAVVAAVQFGVFYRDYFTHYKYRSAFYYDPVAFASVARILLENPAVPEYYFDTELDDAPTKWRFYATKAGRTEVLRRTAYLPRERFPLDGAPPGSLCVIYVDKPAAEALTSSGRWSLVTRVNDVDNREAAAIYRKTS
jgi:hypothetical protein